MAKSLFALLHLLGLREVIFWKKKENQFLKNSKKWFGSFNIKGSPPLDKNRKKSKFFSFLNKNHIFLSEYELEMFSAFFWCIISSFAKNFKFCDILLENIIFDLCHSGAYNSKRRPYSGLYLVSMESKRSEYLYLINLWAPKHVLTTLEGLTLPGPDSAPLSS